LARTDAQLIFHTFVCKIWLGRWTSRCGLQEKNYRQMYGKLEKLTDHLLVKLELMLN